MITNDQNEWALPPGEAPAGAGLSVPPSTDRTAWRRVAGSGRARSLLAQARTEAGAGWPATTASAWLRFTSDGDREEYERAVFAKHARLGRAVLRAAAEPSDEALDRVIDGVIAFCEQSSWCWPAHDDAPSRGERLPDVDRPYLDLGAGEVAAALAWTDHVLGDQLEARATGFRRRVRAETRRRVLVPFLERRDWHWLGLDGDVHNWLPWICGNVLVAALVLEDDATVRRAVLEEAVSGLRRFADSLPADGAIDEGSSYWWNGAGRALEALELLEQATDGAFAAWRDHPALRATIAFPAAMHLGGGWYVSVADANARPRQDLAWPSLFRLAHDVGDEAGVALALSHRGTEAVSEPHRLGRLLQELHDERWWDTPVPAEAPAPRAAAWYPSVQLLVAREPDAHGLTLVAKGGHNAEHHNHNDVGSVIVASDGVPVIADLGRPTYSALTFSARRYEIWTMQSTWHSTPAVCGDAQPPGRDRAASDASVEIGPDGAALTLDLKGAYDVASLESWRRTASLDGGIVRIEDSWRFSAPPEAPSETAFILVGEVAQVSPDLLEVHPIGGGAPMQLRTSHAWSVASRETLDPMLRDVWGSHVFRASCDLGLEEAGTCVVTVSRTPEGAAS